jgi:hypothetical protein
MDGPGRLPLVQATLKLLVHQLPNATWPLGNCAGATVLVLLPTPGSQQNDVLQVISRVILF